MDGMAELIAKDPSAAQQQLTQLIFDTQGTDAETLRQKEVAIGHLGDVYVKLQNAQALRDMLAQLRPFFSVIPKAKTAKIVRSIVDQIAKVPNSTELQVIGLDPTVVGHAASMHRTSKMLRSMHTSACE